MDDPTAFHLLRAFRAGVYTCLGARRDALFEALDAATSVAYLSAQAAAAEAHRAAGSVSQARSAAQAARVAEWAAQADNEERQAERLKIQIERYKDLIDASQSGGPNGEFMFHVKAPQFDGLSLIAQHKLVYAPVQHLIDDGSIHALKIKTEVAT